MVPLSSCQASWDPWQIRLLEVHPPNSPAVAGCFCHTFDLQSSHNVAGLLDLNFYSSSTISYIQSVFSEGLSRNLPSSQLAHTHNVIPPNFSIAAHRSPPTSHAHSRRPNRPSKHPQLSPMCRKPPPILHPPYTTPQHSPTQQICSNTTLATQPQVGNTSTLRTACSPLFRSLTAGCEAVTCNSTDYAATQVLAAQLCSPLYARNAPLSSAVSSAIAYATAAARAATDGKNASDVANLPVCAVSPPSSLCPFLSLPPYNLALSLRHSSTPAHAGRLDYKPPRYPD